MKKSELANLFCEHLARGSLDQYIPELVGAINNRQRAIRDQKTRKALFTLSEPGTKVRITGTIKPKYMIGLEGTVVPRPKAFAGPVRAGTIYVDMGVPIRRYGRILGIPAGCLEEA